MKKSVSIDKKAKVFPCVVAVLGFALMAGMWITRLNITAVISVAFCCIASLLVFIGLLFKRRLYLPMLLGFAAALFGVVSYYIVFGADAGFGAFSSGLSGFSSAENPWLCAEGSFFTRLLGNILLALPSVAVIVLLVLAIKKGGARTVLTRISSLALSVLLMGTSVIYVLTMNLRSKPKTDRLWQGQDDFLGGIDSDETAKPNVLFIMLDDLGWGDISLNGAVYETPNIDSIGEKGTQLSNFYSSYSVCSPSRFAALTGRYPYRGYADNVIYPTVATLSPFAATRIFNSIEMGGNADGMLGDEITLAETLKAAGYKTGCFGKWHLGDYGEYLPTNQGFDYFYGSHHVNDMTPFYHVREEDGEYTIVHGTDELKDQSRATKWINDEMTEWITGVVNSSDAPFFAYYASPWPHAPVFAGDEFDGASGMGTYVDCVTEVDYYIGQLFDRLESLGVLEDTIIIFTSDNGPALEGSTGELRGGKYLAYEGGQKVPFLIRWDNGKNFIKAGETRVQSATTVDLFPTLTQLCSVKTTDGSPALPEDRVIDGVSMVPLLKNDTVIHTPEHPILHMKREDIKAVQYTVPTADILSRDEYKAYNYDILTQNKYITFKYFDRIQNDNSAFFDKYRKNWLHILTDDPGENYNRTPVYPGVADEMHECLDDLQRSFEQNRRGIIGE